MPNSDRDYLESFKNGKFNALCDFVLAYASVEGAQRDPVVRLSLECLGELQGLNRIANPHLP